MISKIQSILLPIFLLTSVIVLAQNSKPIVIDKDQTVTFTPVISGNYCAAATFHKVAVHNLSNGEQVWNQEYPKGNYDWYFIKLIETNGKIIIVGLGKYEIRDLKSGSLLSSGSMDRSITAVKLNESSGRLFALKSEYKPSLQKAVNELVELSLENLAITKVHYTSPNGAHMQLLRSSKNSILMVEGDAGINVFNVTDSKLVLKKSIRMSNLDAVISDVQISSNGSSLYVSDYQSGGMIKIPDYHKKAMTNISTPFKGGKSTAICINPATSEVYCVHSNALYKMNSMNGFTKIPQEICRAKTPAYESVFNKNGDILLLNTSCNGSYDLTNMSSLQIVKF